MDKETANTGMIQDCVISPLSIFPTGNVNGIEKSFASLSTIFGWLNRERFCAKEYIEGDNPESLVCSCFDIYDLFINENSRNQATRFYLGTTFAKWCKKDIRLDIFIKILKEKNIGIIGINISCENFDVSQIISLRHQIESTASIDEADFSRYFSPHPHNEETCDIVGGAIYSMFNIIIEKIFSKRTRKKNTRTTEKEPLIGNISTYNPIYNLQTIIEIRNIGNLSEYIGNAHKWALCNSQIIYGIITGDEAIEYIPKDTCINRLKMHWSSRTFVDVIAFGKSVLVLNTKTTGTLGKRYIEFQKQWNAKYNGGDKRIKYFSRKPCMAGLDHGVLQAVERNMVIRYLYDFIDNQTRKEGKKLNKQRHLLLSFITSTSSPIDEINELFDIVSVASGTNKSIDLIKNKLDIQAEEISIDYQNKNNGIILFLTILSLATAICAIQKNTIIFNLSPTYKIIGAILVLLISLSIITFLYMKVIGYKRKR